MSLSSCASADEKIPRVMVRAAKMANRMAVPLQIGKPFVAPPERLSDPARHCHSQFCDCGAEARLKPCGVAREAMPPLPCEGAGAWGSERHGRSPVSPAAKVPC